MSFDPSHHIQPVQRRKLYQEVAGTLERMILAGTVRAGDSLPSERELMERFEVGRPAIREALMSLEKAGLVELSSGERARVSRPTTARVLRELSAAARMMLTDPEGMRQFQAARRLLEMALAREAARRASPEDIAALSAALELNRAAQGNPALFERADVAFHYEIARIAANPLFLGLHEAMSEWLTEQRTVSLRKPGAERHTLDFHTSIFEGIAARDPDAAESAMRRHLESVADMYWQVADQAAATREPLAAKARKRARR